MNATPFFDTLAIRPLGNGTFAADLHPDWAVGERPHGGYLLALLSRAAVGGGSLQPLSVSAQYLRPPKVGPVLLRTERLKAGRTVTAVRSVLEQSGQTCVDAMITLGELPDEEPAYSDLPEMPSLDTGRPSITYRGVLEALMEEPPRMRTVAAEPGIPSPAVTTTPALLPRRLRESQATVQGHHS